MARSNQAHTMMLHTYIPKPMSIRSINTRHLMVPDMQNRRAFPHHPSNQEPAHLDAMGDNYKT